MWNRMRVHLCMIVGFIAFNLAVCSAAQNRPSPTREPASSERGQVTKSATRVDLNTASQHELEQLPGIGPATAQAIIKARPFRNVNQLTNVSGITPGKLASLKPHVSVTRARSAGSGKAAAVESSSAKSRLQPSAASPNQKINLNTATKDELETLPGIGPVRAQAIIEARPFKSIDDVMKVKGIKEGTFKKIKDQITVQ